MLHRAIAWSCTNLLAISSPAASPAPSLLGPPLVYQSSPLSITMTHLTGLSTAPRARITFTVPLPPSASAGSAGNDARVTHLTFSPCGAYLLAVSSSPSAEMLTVLEQQGGCINQWEPVWSERVARFTGESDTAASATAAPLADPRRVITTRWLGEHRRVCPGSRGRLRLHFD